MKKKEHEIVFIAICFEEVMHEALVESSYLATSVAAMSQPQPPVSSLIVTVDETPLVRRAYKEAYASILPRLSAYATQGSKVDDEGMYFALRLPLKRHEALDDLLLHELRRAIVSYVLSRWYNGKSVQLADDAMRRYEASMTMVLHDIHLSKPGTRRPVTYL